MKWSVSEAKAQVGELLAKAVRDGPHTRVKIVSSRPAHIRIDQRHLTV